nr:hypothetical protein [uncultured Blautia sp.]
MFIKILKKIAGVLIILIGIYFMVSSLKMIFVDAPKMKAALKEAVYVGESAIDPANDGKIVIVCGAFELTEPAYDDELGLSINSIRVSRAKQTMKRKKNVTPTPPLTEEEKRYGVLRWDSVYHDKTFTGNGKIGAYTLSQDFIDNIILDKTWDNYDEAALDAIGYVYVPDKNQSQEHFIEPLAQTQRNDRQDDYRYFYDAASFETGQMVTAIGVQDGHTLKAVSGITDNLMENALDRETAIKQGGVPSTGTNIFSIVFSLLLLLGGAVLLIKQ